VTDRKRRPVSNAIVSVDCVESPGAVARAIAVTGADGQTPADPLRGGILITRSHRIPTPDPAVQTKRHFSYRIEVEADRYRKKKIHVESEAGIPRPLIVCME
jgi:hypothetical protein